MHDGSLNSFPMSARPLSPTRKADDLPGTGCRSYRSPAGLFACFTRSLARLDAARERDAGTVLRRARMPEMRSTEALQDDRWSTG